MKLYKTNERPIVLTLLILLICFAGVQTVSASDDWLISGNKITGTGIGSILVKFDNSNYNIILGFTFMYVDHYVTTNIGGGDVTVLGQPSDGFPFSIERISNNVIVTVPTGSKTYTVPLDVGFVEVVYDETLWNLTFGNPEPEPELSLSHYTIYTTTGVIATISDMPSNIDSIHWENNGIPIPLKDRYVMGWGREWLWISQVGANTITAKLYEGAALKHTLSKTVTYQIWQPGDPIPQGYKVDPTNPYQIIPMAETREEFIRQQQREKINSTPLIGAHLLALTDTVDHYGSSFFNMTMDTTSLLLSPLTAMNYHLNSAITTFEDVGTIAIEGTGLSFLMQVSNRVLSAIPPIIINLISLALIGDTIYLFLNRQV